MIIVDIALAEAFAIEAHGDQQYGKHPYIVHLQAVAALVAKRNKDHPLLTTMIAAAYLHDTIEDTHVTYDDLVKNFGTCVAETVKRVTKVKGEDYFDYLKRVKGGALALEVKKCDTMANMTSSFKGAGSSNPAVRAKCEKGMQKYPRQLMILEEKE